MADGQNLVGQPFGVFEGMSAPSIGPGPVVIVNAYVVEGGHLGCFRVPCPVCRVGDCIRPGQSRGRFWPDAVT